MNNVQEANTASSMVIDIVFSESHAVVNGKYFSINGGADENLDLE